MTVRGSCSCYGHAEKCLPEKPEDEDILGMIYSKVHNFWSKKYFEDFIFLF